MLFLVLLVCLALRYSFGAAALQKKTSTSTHCAKSELSPSLYFRSLSLHYIKYYLTNWKQHTHATEQGGVRANSEARNYKKKGDELNDHF